MRRRIALVCILFLVPVICFNQIIDEINKINADSLQEVLPELEGVDKINALNKIALSVSLNNPDSTIKIANQVIKVSEELDYMKGVADGHFNLGNAYYIMDSLKLSVIHNLSSLRIYEQLPPSIWMGVALNNLAFLNWLVGRTEKSIEYNRQQTRIYDQLEVSLWYKWGSLIETAYFFDGIGRYDSIYYYCDRAFELAKKHNDTSFLAYTYSNLFRFKLRHAQAHPGDKQKLYQCISMGLKALDLRDYLDMDRMGNTIWHLFMYIHLATVYIELGSEESMNTGLEYLNKTERIYDTIDFKYSDIIAVYKLYASLRSRSGDYENAIIYYEKGIEEFERNIPQADKTILYSNIFWEFIDKKILQSVYDSLYRNYERLGNFRKALEFHVLRNKIEGEIFQEDQSNMIAMLEADSENEKIEKQMAMLERDKQIKELQVAQSRYFNLGIGILFVISILIGVLYLRQIKLKNEYKSSILEQKLLRIQMNPHFIFNALSSIHNLVIKDNKDKASAYLVNFSKLLRTSLESSIEDYVLLEDEISIIKSYLELQQLRHDHKFDFSVEVDREINRENTIIPPMLIQPFIENSIEHGIKHKHTKGHVNIKFIKENKKVICKINDDGIGREKAMNSQYEFEKHKSLATGLIRERIRILNKKFHQRIKLDIIDKYSETGQALGTLVRLELPYISD